MLELCCLLLYCLTDFFCLFGGCIESLCKQGILGSEEDHDDGRFADKSHPGWVTPSEHVWVWVLGVVAVVSLPFGVGGLMWLLS